MHINIMLITVQEKIDRTVTKRMRGQKNCTLKNIGKRKRSLKTCDRNHWTHICNSKQHGAS